MNRIDARRNAMKLIYEWQLGGLGGDDTIQGMLSLIPGEAEYDFMMGLVDGVREKWAQLDDIIMKYARGWTIDRLGKVDLAIMRIGVFELTRSIEPTAAVINEAVELAREFSTDKAGAFINGVLGSYARELASM